MNQETRDQLREILCEVPEVDKDVKELRFGCKIKDLFLKSDDRVKFVNNEWWVWTINLCHIQYFNDEEKFEDRFEIIWNKLQEKHLFMYCESKWIRLLRASNWLLFTMSIKESEIKTQKEKLSVFGECEMKVDKEVICILENKDLEDQSEETGQKLIKFLLDNK